MGINFSLPIEGDLVLTRL